MGGVGGIDFTTASVSYPLLNNHLEFPYQVSDFLTNLNESCLFSCQKIGRNFSIFSQPLIKFVSSKITGARSIYEKWCARGKSII